jgi:D-threo-aldose 1-dehydrogenase
VRELTPLGLGGGPLGNLFYGVSDEQARATVAAAWDAGVRYFDTAPYYGLGLAERRLGEALRGRPREDYVLSTKVGRLVVPAGPGHPERAPGIFDVPGDREVRWDFSADGVRRSLADSLDRLGLDRVDMLLLHDPDEHWREAVEEGYPALAALRDEGVVGAIGVGMNQTRMLADFVRYTDVNLVLAAGHYTLLDQEALDELLPLCARRGVAVVGGALFHAGLLASTGYRPVRVTGYRPLDGSVWRTATAIGEVCRRYGVPLAAAAMRFPLGHPSVRSVVVGCHTVEEATADAAAFAVDIPAGFWDELRGRGLIRADAPLPAGRAAE